MSTNGRHAAPVLDSQPPNVPGYAALRSAAAWASAVRGEPIHFGYDPATGHATIAAEGKGALTLKTARFATRPVVQPA